MIRLPAGFIKAIAILLLISPVINALFSFYRFSNPELAITAIVLYLVIGATTVLYFRELRAPLWLAIANLALALVIPQLVNAGLDLSARGSQATWYVTGIATLMAFIAVRQHKVMAWIGSILLVIEVVIWGGIEFMFNSGLGGAIALVAAAHAISVGLEVSAREAASYLEMAKATQAASVADSVIRQERSTRLTQTLRGALPLLTQIGSGEFSMQDKERARLLEAELRDEIRGRELVNPKLKDSVRRARARGVEVVLLDEGGLDGLDDSLKEEIRSRLADEMELISGGRVTIRSSKSDRATFVATRAGEAKPDVFLRL